jgi:hypothetical protein
MELNNIIYDTLSFYGEDMILRMQEELVQNGSLASGMLYNSLSYEVREIANEIILSFNAEDYAKYVENGRKPGKFPPIDKIKQWTVYKGIPKEAAWPIAVNIFKFGIEPRPFIKPVIEDYRTLIIQDLLKVIKSELLNTYTNELRYTLTKKISK